MGTYEDKRRYIRYEILDYAAVHLEETESTLHVVIVDIGLGGLQMRSKVSLTPGTQCDIKVGREGGPLILRCEVRHTSMLMQSDLFATGVRFMPRNHEERMAIAEYVHGIFQRQCDMLTT